MLGEAISLMQWLWIRYMRKIKCIFLIIFFGGAFLFYQSVISPFLQRLKGEPSLWVSTNVSKQNVITFNYTPKTSYSRCFSLKVVEFISPWDIYKNHYGQTLLSKKGEEGIERLVNSNMKFMVRIYHGESLLYDKIILFNRFLNNVDRDVVLGSYKNNKIRECYFFEEKKTYVIEISYIDDITDYLRARIRFGLVPFRVKV